MDHPWINPFLDRLRATGIAARAAREVGAPYSNVMALRRRDADFAAAFDEALEESYDTLEGEARRRALEGVEEPIVHQGTLTPVWELDEACRPVLDDEGRPVQARHPDGSPKWLTVRKHSDALLQFLLKGYRKKFGTERTELTGADGGPVAMDDTARAARVAQLIALAQQRATDIDPDDIA